MSDGNGNGKGSASPTYDHAHIADIIEALDFLKRQALRSGNVPIAILIGACFDMCFVAHELAKPGLETHRRSTD